MNKQFKKLHLHYKNNVIKKFKIFFNCLRKYIKKQ